MQFARGKADRSGATGGGGVQVCDSDGRTGVMESWQSNVIVQVRVCKPSAEHVFQSPQVQISSVHVAGGLTVYVGSSGFDGVVVPFPSLGGVCVTGGVKPGIAPFHVLLFSNNSSIKLPESTLIVRFVGCFFDFSLLAIEEDKVILLTPLAAKDGFHFAADKIFLPSTSVHKYETLKDLDSFPAFTMLLFLIVKIGRAVFFLNVTDLISKSGFVGVSPVVVW